MKMNRWAILFLVPIFLHSAHAEEPKAPQIKLHGFGGKRAAFEGNDKTSKLAEWLELQVEQTPDLTESRLKEEFGLSKDELMADGSGFSAGSCTEEGCTFEIKGSGLLGKGRGVRILNEKGKAVKVAAAGEKPKFDEHGNRIISSQAELEAALKKEGKKKVALLFSSSIKKDDKFYSELKLKGESLVPVKAPTQVLYKGEDGKSHFYPISALQPGRYPKGISLPNDQGVWTPVANFVKGPSPLGVKEGEFALQRAAEKLVKKVGDKYEPYDLAQDSAGRKTGIYKMDGDGNYSPLTVVKGPLHEEGKQVATEGQVLVESSGMHCPPCRLLDSHMKKIKENEPETAIYVVDTGGFVTGGTPELHELRNTYIKDMGWPNGVLLTKGAKADSEVAGYGITQSGNGVLPNYLINAAFPNSGMTWQGIFQAEGAKFR